MDVLIRVLELSMLICFGASWPFSTAKIWKNRSVKGVSPVFLVLLLVGYALGITMKILRGDFVYVGFFYVFNFILVFVNFISYLHFKRLEKQHDK